MNNENMLKWAEALESGKYRQYRNGWCSEDRNEMCCLDVACVVFTGKHYLEHNLVGAARVLDNSLNIDQIAVDMFINMNDVKGLSFNQIAAHIRKMVEEA